MLGSGFSPRNHAAFCSKWQHGNNCCCRCCCACACIRLRLCLARVRDGHRLVPAFPPACFAYCPSSLPPYFLSLLPPSLLPCPPPSLPPSLLPPSPPPALSTPTTQSNGSARVTIAHNGTDVLAAVKVSTTTRQPRQNMFYNCRLAWFGLPHPTRPYPTRLDPTRTKLTLPDRVAKPPDGLAPACLNLPLSGGDAVVVPTSFAPRSEHTHTHVRTSRLEGHLISMMVCTLRQYR